MTVQVTFTFEPEDEERDDKNYTGLTNDAYENLLMTLDHKFGSTNIEVYRVKSKPNGPALHAHEPLHGETVFPVPDARPSVERAVEGDTDPNQGKLDVDSKLGNDWTESQLAEAWNEPNDKDKRG